MLTVCGSKEEKMSVCVCVYANRRPDMYNGPSRSFNDLCFDVFSCEMQIPGTSFYRTRYTLSSFPF